MAYQIVLGKYKEIPTFTFYEEFNDNAYIITLIESDLIVLKEFADTWQDNFKMHLDDFTYVQEYEIQNSRNDIMFYFLSLNQGSAFGIAYFNLYSLKENTVYTITASGPHSAYNKITIPKDIENNRPDVFLFLEKKVSESKYIKKETEDNLNINNPQNADVLWGLANKHLYDSLAVQTNKWFPLNAHKYNTENIDNFFNEEARNREGTKWEFENSRYKITSYFKGAIYAFDKIERKYFVLWVPSNLYDWTQKIEFYNNHSIILFKIGNENRPLYKIDLQKMIIMKI